MTSPLHFVVYVEGHKTAHHVGDPLAAIHAAEKALEQDPDVDVAIVVLDGERAGLSEAELAVRPFVSSPGGVAAEATAAARRAAA